MSGTNGAGRKCGFVLESGQRCPNNAMLDSDPARCAPHREDDGPRVGAPAGNKNRLTHGMYSASEKPLQSIDDVLLDALDKQTRLSTYIEKKLADDKVTPESMATLFSLHGQNASRLGRLYRDQKVLETGGIDELLDVVGQALDEFSDEVGVLL